MTDLSAEQKAQVCAWVTEGASLGEVQNRIRAEFGLHPTFFDVRMLVMELNVQVKDKEAQIIADDVTKAKLPPKPNAPTPAAPSPAAGGVSVSIDTLQVVPGALVSGGVTFSDGVKARWYFDQMGRFAFEPELPGYKPTPEDSRTFQQTLQQELSSRGY